MRIPSLYVLSTGSFCGKSALSLGLALKFRESGYKVGYFKPVSWETSQSLKGETIDEDAQLMKEVLKLDLSLDTLAPVILGARFIEDSLKLNLDFYKEKILKAYEQASKEMNLMIIEGSKTLGIGSSLEVDAMSLVKIFGSEVIMVTKIDNDSDLDEIIWQKKYIEKTGAKLVGVAISCVPKTVIERIKGFSVPILRKHNVNILGIIPDEVSLRAPTVKEICEKINGEVLVGEDKLGNLVEGFLVGAMTSETALAYFRGAQRKAVITGGDRPRILLAALETDTSALILTGNLYPDVRVLARAEELGVPVILVPNDTYTTVTKMAAITGKIRPVEKKKIELAKNLVEDFLDWKFILETLIG